ncbi:Peroxisomal membrane protein PAS20 [Monascus purpureus]|uniref:Peroxisomal membrane protein PEX13 n=1 Tax=Monascus purpureus TaxID=5098 RepID=A0A507QTY5_MONPU|nr:Peroxisomal membrane protein PAS20 [Monascus purpureus]
MATVSPPKPWERAGAGGAPLAASSTTTAGSGTTATSPAANGTTASSSAAPDLPSRPNSLNSVVNRTATNYSPYSASRFGTSPYGSYGGYGSYSSPYSRFGTMGSMYGGYGGYGGMYGGMGGIQSTQATFQMLESIVGAFGGFAQMLESTYMATHSSFFAMVSVAEQFGNLRNTLGSALGIFTIIRWLKTLFAKLTGRPPPADATALTPSAFEAFMHGRSVSGSLPDGSPVPKPSKKPFLVFVLAVFGLPYLMGKLIKALARSQEEEMKRRQQLLVGANGEMSQADQPAPLDPSKLDFCRVLYDYTPESQESSGIDLAVKKGDIVAVLSKSDPMGNASEWWRCRARDGRVGYLPGPYLETIQRRPAQQAITSGSTAGSRSSTMNEATAKIEELRAQQHAKQAVEKKPELKGKMGDISPESFQKSAFYS